MALTTVKSDQIQTSVALAGSPTTTTQSASDNSTKIATTAYADTAVANLVASAPASLNTLDELAAALNDDANFASTITTSIAAKLPLAGGTLTGALNMGSQNITNAGTISSGSITATGSLNSTSTSGLGIQTSGYSLLSAANNARAASGSLRLGNGAGSTGLVIDYTDQGQTVATIRNVYVASNSSELTIQSPFITFDTGTSYTEALKLDHDQSATFKGNVNVFGTNRKLAIGESGAGGTFGHVGWDDASNYLYLGTSYNSAFNQDVVLKDGSVGIGTSSPTTGKLQVKGAGTSSSTNAIFAENSSGAGLFAIRDNGDAFILGSTGIGVSSPGQTLAVLNAYNYNPPGLGNSSGQFFFGKQDGGGAGSYGLIGGTAGTGNSWLQAQRIDGTATAYNILLQPSGGNVGIGATTPSQKLHVAGKAYATEGFTTDGIAKSYTWRAIDNSAGSGTRYVKICRITASQSSRVSIELNGRDASYGNGSFPAHGHLVGQLNNDNNYDFTYYNYFTGSSQVVTEIGQVDIDAASTDIYVKISSFAEIAAVGVISDGDIYPTTGNAGASQGVGSAPTGYTVITSQKIIMENTSGNVGIGTSAPLGKLHIRHDMYTGNNVTELESSQSVYGGLTFEGNANTGAGSTATTQQGITWRVNNYNGSTDYGNQAQLVVGNNGDVGTFMGFFTSNNYSSYPRERVRINSDGIMTQENLPAFNAYYNGSLYSPNNNETFAHNTTRFDNGSNFNTTYHRFTAPVSGVYFFEFRTIIYGNGNNGHLGFRKNGSQIHGANVHYSHNEGNVWKVFSMHTIQDFAKHDYIDVYNHSRTCTYYHGGTWNEFSGYLVG